MIISEYKINFMLKKYRPDKAIGVKNRTMTAMNWKRNKELTVKGQHVAI